MHYITPRHQHLGLNNVSPAPLQPLTGSTDLYRDHDHVLFVSGESAHQGSRVILTLSFRRSMSLKGQPHRTRNVKRYKAGCKYGSVSFCTRIPNYSNLPKCNIGQNSLISIDASLNIPFDATKPLNGHQVLFTPQYVTANFFHYWIYGRLETASMSSRNVD
jgi:hypothetical protein